MWVFSCLNPVLILSLCVFKLIEHEFFFEYTFICQLLIRVLIIAGYIYIVIKNALCINTRSWACLVDRTIDKQQIILADTVGYYWNAIIWTCGHMIIIYHFHCHHKYVAVLIFPGCHDRVPQAPGFTSILFFRSSGSWKSEMQVPAGCTSPESFREWCFHASFSFWESQALLGLWQPNSNLSLCYGMTVSSKSASVSRLMSGFQSCWMKACLQEPILTSLYLQRHHFQIKSHSQVALRCELEHLWVYIGNII